MRGSQSWTMFGRQPDGSMRIPFITPSQTPTHVEWTNMLTGERRHVTVRTIALDMRDLPSVMG